MKYWKPVNEITLQIQLTQKGLVQRRGGGTPTTRTSCLVWTARLLSTHWMHIHRYHRKLSTFGTSIKTLSCQLEQWTSNSMAPLWPGRINAAFQGVKALLGWGGAGMEPPKMRWPCWTTCKGVRLGPVLWRKGNASSSTLSPSRVWKGTPVFTLVQRNTCLKEEQIKWVRFFHLKISFKGIWSCLRRWIHCVCFLH